MFVDQDTNLFDDIEPVETPAIDEEEVTLMATYLSMIDYINEGDIDSAIDIDIAKLPLDKEE